MKYFFRINIELGSSALDAAPQMWPHQGRAEGEKSLDLLATLLNAPQGTTDLLGTQGTLLACYWLGCCCLHQNRAYWAGKCRSSGFIGSLQRIRIGK